MTSRCRSSPPLVPAAAVVAGDLVHQGPPSWLFEAGLHVPGLAAAPTAWDLALGRPGAGAPAWLSVGVLVAALAALLRPDTRAAVLRAWLVVVVALGTTAVLAAGTFAVTGAPAEQPLWLGFPLVRGAGRRHHRRGDRRHRRARPV